MKKKVLVLMAVCNGEKYLKQQIESILSQDKIDVDLMINLDKSNDKSSAIIKHYLNKKNVFLNKEGYFGSAAKNFINLIINAPISKYDLIALSDQDDVWNTDKLKIASEIIDRSYDCYSSNVTAWWPKKNKFKLIIKSQKQAKYDHFFESAGPGCTYVLSKKFAIFLQKLINHQKPKIEKYHDHFIYFVARLNKFNWFIDDRPTMLYRQHSLNELGANVSFKNYLNRLNQILDGSWQRQLINFFKAVKKDHPHVSNFYNISKLNKVYILKNFYSCRRRIRDKFIFFLFISFFCLSVHNKNTRKN